MSKDSPVRIGVIGAGQIVENSHLPALCSREDVSVSWVADVRLERSQQLAEMYQCKELPVADVEGAIADLDLCLLAIPIGVREKYIEQCRRYGVGIYVEKPFARSLEEHDLICDGFQPYQVAIGYQRRTYQAVQQLKYVLENELFGAPLEVSCQIGGFSMKSGGATYLADSKMSGGGVLIELGVHALDQVLLLLGAEEIRVESAAAIIRDNQDFHIRAESSLKRCTGWVKCKTEFSRMRPLENGLTVKCENGTLRINMSPSSPIWLVSLEGTAECVLQGLSTGHGKSASTSQEAFAAIWDEFLVGYAEKKRNLADALSGRLTTQWIEELYDRVS